MSNTKFSYLYRDAGNWKVPQEVVLKGEISKAEIQEIMEKLDSGEYFIPEQVGLPLIRTWEVTEDDHPFCEMDENSFELTDRVPTENMTVEDLVREFRKVKYWDDVKYAPEID